MVFAQERRCRGRDGICTREISGIVFRYCNRSARLGEWALIGEDVTKIVFSSDQLPANLDDAGRFELWRDMYTAQYGAIEVARLLDAPFSQYSEFIQIGAVGLTRSRGTITDMLRTARQASTDARGDFLIGFSRATVPIAVSHRGREVALTENNAVLLTNAEAVESHCRAASTWGGIVIPRALLLQRLPLVEDELGTLLSQAAPAVLHLVHYAEFLVRANEVHDDPVLAEQASTTLLDLVALALAAQGDAAEIAKLRGQRAARTQQILAEIRKGYARPSFCAADVAATVGISHRYLQELLQRTGIGFTDRVQELRLQKARAMLLSPQFNRHRVTEIAHASGFNDISHFNVSFRRRFGASPTQFRGKA